MKGESGMPNMTVYTDGAAARPEVKQKTEMSEVVQAQAQAQAQVQAPATEQTGADVNAPKRIKDAVDHANQTMKHAKTKCEFSYHEATKRVSIKFIDEETDEVIREIPPEETLEMISKMWELAGLMVDEKR